MLMMYTMVVMDIMFFKIMMYMCLTDRPPPDNRPDSSSSKSSTDRRRTFCNKILASIASRTNPLRFLLMRRREVPPRETSATVPLGPERRRRGKGPRRPPEEDDERIRRRVGGGERRPFRPAPGGARDEGVRGWCREGKDGRTPLSVEDSVRDARSACGCGGAPGGRDL